VDDYAGKVSQALTDVGVINELDLRNEKIGYKVREHSKSKVPVILVLGEKEAAEGQVAIRRLGSQDTEVMALEAAVALLKDQTRMPR
jgi:threonyl-tRNA synthetase